MSDPLLIQLKANFWGCKRALWKCCWNIRRCLDSDCPPGLLAQLNPKILRRVS